MKHFELSYTDMNALFDKMDTNKDNLIEYTEFLSAAMSKKISISEDNMKMAFHFFDKVDLFRIMMEKFLQQNLHLYLNVITRKSKLR